MRRANEGSFAGRLRRPVGVGLVLAAILFGATGVSCDDDAEAAFRQEATSAIGTGVKTILDGVVDGLVAAIENAGDGGDESSSSQSSSSQ